MGPGLWQQIERIYHAAAELPLEKRAVFLDRECAGDPELCEEVERMLAVESDAGGFLQAPAMEVTARALAAAEPVTVGSRLGPYEIVSLLGEGGMGEVYKARDTRLDRTVAIKVLPAFGADDADGRKRFLREARVASALNHPNIVTLHDILGEEGRDALVMEYLEGATLEDKIGHKGLPLREALAYAIQMADGLAAAHRAGIVHRDVKPANVMVSDSGTVKLLDFGVAKLTCTEPGDEHKQTLTTADGRILGTVAHMSPEQAEGRKVDARSDIFSFGVALYEMLTGRKPFLRDTTASTLAAILRDEFDPSGRHPRESAQATRAMRAERPCQTGAEHGRYQGGVGGDPGRDRASARGFAPRNAALAALVEAGHRGGRSGSVGGSRLARHRPEQESRDAEETLMTKEKLNSANYWALGNQGLYFTEPRETEHKTILKLFRFETGQSSQIAVLDQPFPSSSIRLSLPSDGRWLLYDQLERYESDIMLIENFR